MDGRQKEPLTKDELLEKLAALVEYSWSNVEKAHKLADDLLLQYIGDDEITEAYNAFDKLYG